MPQPPRRDWSYAILAATMAAAVVRLWLQRLNHGFGLDETLIVWTVRDGFTQIIPRAFISLQSIAFCLLEWVASLKSGPLEVAFRVLPLAAGIATLLVLYRIGVEILDSELGVVYAALWLALPAIAVETPLARPYALASLAHVAALLWLLRWLRSCRLRDGAYWAICAALACHFHHLFAMAVPLEAGAALWCSFRGTRVSPRQVLICTFGFAVLLLPAIPQGFTMLKMGRALSFAEKPSALELLMALMPVVLGLALAVLGIGTWAAGKRPRWIRPGSGGETALLAAVFLGVPVVGLFALSELTDVRLFVSRYLLPTAPGFVILWGWIARGIEPAGLRRLSLVATVATSVLVISGHSAAPVYAGEDWRAAVHSLPDSGAMLVYSGLVETRRLDWLQVPQRWSYLSAPVSVYRPAISPADVFMVPFEFGPEEMAYMDQLLAGPLSGRKTIVLIARTESSGPDWSSWLARRLADAGFQRERDSDYGSLDVHVFERNRRPIDFGSNPKPDRQSRRGLCMPPRWAETQQPIVPSLRMLQIPSPHALSSKA